MRHKPQRTIDIARALGVHPNTLRLYETLGYLPPVPRAANGYRRFSPLHVEHARLAIMTLSWPYVTERQTLITLVVSAARADYGAAMELAYQNLTQIRIERTYAESAVEFLERWAAGYPMDAAAERMHITQAAQYLRVTVDMLRNWERNGLITVPRDPQNGYRLYGVPEFGRLRVIRMLVQSGYSLMSILRMFRQFDAGSRHNLREALEVPPEDSASEHLNVIADRWLSSLISLEERAQAIIRQISLLMEMARQP
jgi:DNA-binding transcriptional MerR regulator